MSSSNPNDSNTSAARLNWPVDSDRMSGDFWLAFHTEVHGAVTELGLNDASITPSVVRLRNGRSLSLLQLAQHCSSLPSLEWNSLIAGHLRTMTAYLDQISEPLSMFDLRIRLVPDTLADAETLHQLGGRPFVDGVIEVLAIDVDDAVRCVPTSEIAANGWDVDEAWVSARLQTELLEVPDEIHIVDIGSADLIHVFGERPFTASTVGVIDDLIAEYAQIGDLGAIVSMPLRHSVLVHPIDNASAQCGIAGMIPIAHQLFKQGPGSVSPHLYWWRDGSLEWIPTFFDGTTSGSEFYPSPELAAALADVTR